MITSTLPWYWDISATIASNTHSHCYELPDANITADWQVLAASALHLLPIAYWTVHIPQDPHQKHIGPHPTCTRCLMQHLHFPLGGVTQHRALPRISATLLS